MKYLIITVKVADMDDIINIDSSGSIDLYTEYDEFSDNSSVVGSDPESYTENYQTIQDTSKDRTFDASTVNESVDNSEPLIVNNTEYINDNTEVIEELKKVNENIVNLSGDPVNDTVSNNVVSVSSNEIMTKAIQDYSVSESLSLMIFLTLFCAGLVFIIRKGLYKWT